MDELGDLILADTDVLIDYFNGASPIAEEVETLIRKELLAVSVISIFELYAGVIGKKRLESIDLLLQNAVLLPLETESAKIAGKFFTDLKSTGRLIGNQDLLIAAIAYTYGLPLFTRNTDHFSRIKKLVFYHTTQP